MFKKIIKYFSYTLIIFVSLWGIIISGLYFYLSSNTGQKFLVSFIQENLKSSANIDTRVEKLTGTLPFSFSIGLLEISKNKLVIVRVKDFSSMGYWKALFYGNLHIGNISAEKIDIYMPQKKSNLYQTEEKRYRGKDITTATQEIQNNNQPIITWPKTPKLSISAIIDKFFIKKITIHDSSKIFQASGVEGKLYFSQFGSLDLKLKGKIEKPEKITLQMHADVLLPKKQAKILLNIKKSKYATGIIKCKIWEKSLKALSLGGSLEARINKSVLGPASSFIGLLKMDFNLLYKKDEVYWQIKGGDGGLINLDKKGTYKKNQDLWSTIGALITNGVENLVAQSIKKPLENNIKKLKNKLIKKVSKNLPQKALKNLFKEVF